jgi:hypothetical protein
MRPVVLKSLSTYLFVHMRNVKIESHTYHMRQFKGKLVLYSKLKKYMENK